MSFVKCEATVQAGDVVIVYLSHDSMIPITACPNEISQTKYGALKHNDLIGHKYGKKFSCSKGWVYVLQPTPELWTMCLPHRTQILYAADIAMIIFQLELKPGSIVCESGTGSGSLSHALLRTIAPTGHLHTVEFNADRHNKATAEFDKHGFADNVSTYYRDVLKEGFPIQEQADAVFLDIPQPDVAIPQAAKALKRSGSRLCSFSPCMEQTQRTCDVLNKPGSGFYDVHTLELVKKSFNVKRIMVPVADIGLNDGQVKKTLVSGSVAHVLPCAYEPGDRLPLGEVVIRSTPDPGVKRRTESNVKRLKTDSGDAEPDVTEKGRTPPAATKFAFATRTCLSPKEIYGHTGYLTFASYCPDVCLLE